ncbi:MAG: methyltransferase domain-containing protein [Thermoleophilia bacterium]
MSEWNAESYERVSDPQVGWAAPVLDRLPLRGDETVVDAGCGTGRVTRMLAERLPRGRVIAVDGSLSMVEEARRRLADLAPRVEVRHSDLLALTVPEPVDAILSTATFHWIVDHPALFARLHDALAPGGRLVAQCGGHGNIERVLQAAAAIGRLPAYSPHLAGFENRILFADGPTTVLRLEAAGFADARAWLEPAPVHLQDLATGTEFLATVVLRRHLEELPENLREPYARDVARRLRGGKRRVPLDYVRLNLEARRPS